MQWTLLCVLALVGACSDEHPVAPPPSAPDAEQLAQAAWEQFEAGDLTAALAGFDQSAAADPTYAEAQVGRGWCLLVGADGVDALTSAETAFSTAVALDPADPDAPAARAAARLALGGDDLAGAVVDAEAVLLQHTDYAFPHVPGYTTTALRLVSAQVQVALGDFAATLTTLDAVLASPLDAGNPDTWVIEGNIESSFEAAVLAQLSRISALWRAGML